MRNQSDELAHYVTAELRRLADPAKAPAMAAYMKTAQPFYGVQTPTRTTILREAHEQFVPSDQKSYERNVLALWKLPYREERYCAIAYARNHPRFITPSALPLYERMIREGAWWDFVDDIAVNLVGGVLGNFPAKTGPIIERWIDDPDMWIRRTALLAHLKHRKTTDSALLVEHCLRRAHESEFFIRKAIGWALREYSKTDPRAVGAFLKKNRQRLSKLSFDEGSKHLARTQSEKPRAQKLSIRRLP